MDPGRVPPSRSCLGRQSKMSSNPLGSKASEFTSQRKRNSGDVITAVSELIAWFCLSHSCDFLPLKFQTGGLEMFGFLILRRFVPRVPRRCFFPAVSDEKRSVTCAPTW